MTTKTAEKKSTQDVESIVIGRFEVTLRWAKRGKVVGDNHQDCYAAISRCISASEADSDRIRASARLSRAIPDVAEEYGYSEITVFKLLPAK